MLKKRGAKIYAEVVGYGTTCDAYHITAPAPGGEGGARAIKMAIDDSGINEEQISYINAHGTGTPYNDKSETEAIKTIFGKKSIRYSDKFHQINDRAYAWCFGSSRGYYLR